MLASEPRTASTKGAKPAKVSGQELSSTGLSVAEVRTALFALRHAWYEKCTPDGPPFLFSDPAIGDLSMATFGCIFDYGQHVKRHQRLVRSGGGGGRRSGSVGGGGGGERAGRSGPRKSTVSEDPAPPKQ